MTKFLNPTIDDFSISLKDEHKDIQELARDFANNEISPIANKIDQEDCPICMESLQDLLDKETLSDQILRPDQYRTVNPKTPGDVQSVYQAAKLLLSSQAQYHRPRVGRRCSRRWRRSSTRHLLHRSQDRFRLQGRGVARQPPRQRRRGGG